MTDRALDAEIACFERARREILDCEEVSDFVKEEVREHYRKVAQEAEKRDREEWIYPVDAFFLNDWAN